ncbi:ABC-2 transporter permease [uncultured Intestinimonas sp.]|uniref:ABC-2 transporter permease n=1 Tax=uncultured Intestinimonas sp. TaxID=1689265 RepID=UPI0025E3CB8B|nr:ABC-2 transporter permease [uncultured Intestinimonas sp.]
MTGLVKKDLYLSLSMFKSYVAVAAVFAALTAFGIYDISFFVTYVSIMCIMIPVNLFAYDEQARWDKYAAALPSGRAGVVKARYLLTILVCAGSLVFSLLLQLIVALVSGAQGQARVDLLLSGLLPAAYGCFMNAILLPLLFRFGSQKARLYLILVLGVGVGVIFGGLTGLKEMGLSLSALRFPLFVLPVVGLLALIPSYLFSKRIFFHRDL